jgi:hypothetical protein
MGFRNHFFFLELDKKLSERLVFCLISFLIILFPIVLLKFPPATDLPQHIAQVRLFFENFQNASSPFQVQWYAPNNLIYLIIGITWKIVDPENVGRITMIFIVFAWLIVINFISAKRSRAIDNTIIASLLIFNHAFYWGFLNFLIGWPVFIIWFLIVTPSSTFSIKKEFLYCLLVSFLLYESHALWFAVGIAWVIIINLIKKTPPKIFLVRIAAIIPWVILALIWYPTLSSSRTNSGFDVAPHWFTLPFERLSPEWLVNAAFGGLKGSIEIVAFCSLLVFVAISLWQKRKQLKANIDQDLLLVAMFFFVIAFFAPDKYMNTIYFSSRWFPCGMMLLLLSLPELSLSDYLRHIGCIVIVTLFCISTAFTWKDYSQMELSGLETSLDGVPYNSRVIGLDFVKESDYIKNRPFLQLFAYAQVFRGGDLNFSFAEHVSGIIAYKTERPRHWTPGLEWMAERVQKSDLKYFDYAMINAKDEIHKIFSSMKEVTPLMRTGRWRIYKVEHYFVKE